MVDSKSEREDRAEREARAEIAETEEAAERSRTARGAGLFDLRRIIGGLLGLYGVVLTLMGLFASHTTKSKAVGININLWTGLALLVAAAVFLAWLVLRPLRPEDLAQLDEPAAEQGPEADGERAPVAADRGDAEARRPDVEEATGR
jgi:hypothetical protein